MGTIRLTKDGVIHVFQTWGDHVITTTEISGRMVSNPFLTDMYLAGWTDAPEPPAPEPELPTVEELVESALRTGADGMRVYSLNQELEIARFGRKANPTPEEQAAIDLFDARVEAAIDWANAQPHKSAGEGE